MKTISVALGARTYDIVVGGGALAEASRLLKSVPRSRSVIITHPTLARRYGFALQNALRAEQDDAAVLTVPAGERSKRLQVVQKLAESMAKRGCDRSTLVIALGGGVVGDVAGFVASIYMRGVACVQLPTSLLAQVDASIGGKTGVDLNSGKNLVGAIHQPKMVIVDPHVLRSLPRRHFINGMAEVLKYGFAVDATVHSHVRDGLLQIIQRREPELTEIIAACCAAKARVVAEDEHDLTGSRARLNFGHTIGHALESALNYTQLLHGEAVALGMLGAARLGAMLGVTPKTVVDEVTATVLQAGLPMQAPNGVGSATIMDAMHRDKKTEQGELRFVLLNALGESVLTPVPDSSVRAALAGLGIDP